MIIFLSLLFVFKPIATTAFFSSSRMLRIWSSSAPRTVFPETMEYNTDDRNGTFSEDCVVVSDDPITEKQNSPPSTKKPDIPEETQEEDDLHWFRFGGVGRLFADESRESDLVLERLRSSTVAIVGLGGVGSWAAEALFRSGIGHLVLIDLDDICVSGTDSQVHALANNVGTEKIDAMRQRLLNISPYGRITLIRDFVLLSNVQEIVGQQLKNEHNVTVVIDAIDGDEEKAALLSACVDHGLPVVTCGSAAGRTDPTQLACDDLSQLNDGDDRQLLACRKLLQDKFGFPSKSPSSNAVWYIPSVYSREPLKSSKRITSAVKTSSSFRSDSNIGTASFVTGSFGFVATSRVVDMIVSQEFTPPTRG